MAKLASGQARSDLMSSVITYQGFFLVHLGQTIQPPETQLDPSVQNYIQQMVYAQYMQHQPSTRSTYAQVVANISNKEISSPYSNLVSNINDVQVAVTSDDSAYSKQNETKIKPAKPETVLLQPVVKNTLLSLADYGSDSESENDEDKAEEFKVPVGETQIVIDKMASYVAKNGVQFEEIVKAKGDPRFEFLCEKHEYYKYYKSRIKSLVDYDDKKDTKAATVIMAKPKEKKIIGKYIKY